MPAPKDPIAREIWRLKIGASRKGIKRSPETCTKISLAQKGRPGKPQSEEAKEKNRQAHLGKAHPWVSLARKGTILSDEVKAKISASKMGHEVSDETREKIRIANTGKVLSQEQREKIRAANLGVPKPKPEGFGQKISEIKTGRHYPKLSEAQQNSSKPRVSAALKGRPKPPEEIQRRLDKNGGDYKSFRNSPQYKVWTVAVKTRDGYICKRCGITEIELKEAQRLLGVSNPKGLHAHHIKDATKYPELRYDVDNGMSLCDACHRIVESEAIRISINIGIERARLEKVSTVVDLLKAWVAKRQQQPQQMFHKRPFSFTANV